MLVHLGLVMDKAALGQVSLPAPVYSFIHPSITEAIEYQQFTASLSSTNAAKLRLKAIITLVLHGLVHPSQQLEPLVSRCE